MKIQDLEKILDALPYGYSIETVNDNQLVIYTNMQETDPDELEEFISE